MGIHFQGKHELCGSCIKCLDYFNKLFGLGRKEATWKEVSVKCVKVNDEFPSTLQVSQTPTCKVWIKCDGWCADVAYNRCTANVLSGVFIQLIFMGLTHSTGEKLQSMKTQNPVAKQPSGPAQWTILIEISTGTLTAAQHKANNHMHKIRGLQPPVKLLPSLSDFQ